MAILQTFGELDDGRESTLYTLSNGNGMEVKITDFGGIVTTISVPDKHGKFENVVLGFDHVSGYLESRMYLGALIGRYGNRIAGGRLVLDGKEYRLTTNDGENHLHGGHTGFDKVLWNVEEADGQSLKLNIQSPEGEEGYPGNLEVTALYTLSDQNELNIDFKAVTDQATPVNLTAHSYFNLSGDVSKKILDHKLKLHATNFTPVDARLIPTGEIIQVDQTPFDFTGFKKIGDSMDQVDGGYDHNFVLDDPSDNLKLAAELLDEENGRKMDVYTTEPGIQFYSGNFLDGSFGGPDGTPYEQHGALCLEPQHFPDSPNQPDFPSSILRPGDEYRSTISYRFSS